MFQKQGPKREKDEVALARNPLLLRLHRLPHRRRHPDQAPVEAVALTPRLAVRKAALKAVVADLLQVKIYNLFTNLRLLS